MKTNLIFLFQLLLTLILTAKAQPPQFHFAGGFCNSNETISINSTYHNNTLTLFTKLESFSSVNTFTVSSSGVGNDSVNGLYLYLCRPDLPLSTCEACIKTTTSVLEGACFNQKEAMIWYEECMMRYTNTSIDAADTNGTDPWDYRNSILNVSNPETFPTLLNKTIQSMISEVILPTNSPKYFATKSAKFTPFETLFGMVLCRPDITTEACESCLKTAFDRIPICCGGLSSYAMVLLPSCQLRYDTARFIFSNPPPSSPSLASSPAPGPAPADLAPAPEA